MTSTPSNHGDEAAVAPESKPAAVSNYAEVAFDIDSGDLPKGYYRSSFFIGTLIASGLSVSAGVGGFALAAPLLGTINADIGPDPNYVWIGLVYTLTLAIGQVLVGRLSDLFSRRWFFILGSALALLGCIISAVAKDIPTLIGGTALIGFAAAPQLSYTFVIGELIPFKYRFLSMSYVYTWAVPFSGLGPAISYAFVQHSSHTWRACYYLMIGINGASVAFWFFFYHPPTFNDKYAHKKTKMQVLRDLDYVGLVLFIAGLLIFLMGLSWGGSLYPWKSAHVIGTIVVGGVALIIFVFYETFVPLKEPLVPVHLFRNLPWVADIFLVALGASVYYAFSIVWPQMVFTLYTSNLTRGGYYCCVPGSAINAGQILGGISCRHIGKQKWQLVVTATSAAAFLGGAACATPFNPNTIIALMFMGCFSVGFMESVGLAISGISVHDQSEIGTAVGISGCIRSTVSTIAATIYTVVLTNRLGKNIPSEVPPKLIAAGLPSTSVPDFLAAIAAGTPDAFSKVEGLTDSIQAIGIAAYKLASSHAYRTVFFATLSFSTVGIICAYFSPNVDELMTGRVIATFHRKADEENFSEK